MADVAVAVRAYLLGKSAITDIIGQRLYTDILPQGATLPAVTIEKISETYEHALSGLAGLVSTRLQFTCFAMTRASAEAIADAIIWSGIDAVKGVTNGCDIRSVMVDSGKLYRVDYATDGSDAQRYVTSFDLMADYLRS